MKKKARRKYSDEFKAEAVKLVTDKVTVVRVKGNILWKGIFA